LLFLGRLNEPEILSTSVISPDFDGDFNDDGVVDSADYVAWRNDDGTPAGYDAWRANFGRSVGTGALSNSAVPEPAAGLAILSAVGVTLMQRRFRRGA
jgi:hypothetical protein